MSSYYINVLQTKLYVYMHVAHKIHLQIRWKCIINEQIIIIIMMMMMMMMIMSSEHDKKPSD